MVRKVSAGHAKAHLSALMGEVAQRGSHILIERRGKPLAALVSVTDMERLGLGQTTSSRPQGALALVGAWRDVEDRTLDALIADVYAGRSQDTDRPVENWLQE